MKDEATGCEFLNNVAFPYRILSRHFIRAPCRWAPSVVLSGTFRQGVHQLECTLDFVSVEPVCAQFCSHVCPPSPATHRWPRHHQWAGIVGILMVELSRKPKSKRTRTGWQRIYSASDGNTWL